MSSKGQAMIEALFFLPFSIAIGGGLLLAFYLAFATLVIRSHLQEAILCLQNNNPVSLCQLNFTSLTEETLPLGHVEKILLEKNPLKITGKAVFLINEELQVDEWQELPQPFLPFNEVTG